VYRPAFRVTQSASTCSNSELLAALIGGPKQIELAEALLLHFGGEIRRLYHTHPVELAKVKGINQAPAICIKAVFNRGLHLNHPNEERPTVNSPADAAALVQYEMSLLEKEHLRVMLLDTRNHVLGIVQAYKGLNSSQVRVAEIFKDAIALMAPAIIVFHNHPSGDNTPSLDDVAVTRAIVQAGKLLDVSCLDHIVIGQGGSFCSLKESGLGFN